MNTFTEDKSLIVNVTKFGFEIGTISYSEAKDGWVFVAAQGKKGSSRKGWITLGAVKSTINERFGRVVQFNHK